MLIVDGGAGDDTIEGDGNLQWYYAAPWSVTRTVTEESGAPLYYREYAGVDWEGIAVEQGDDIIYAGSGNDWVFAQCGNDFVDAGIGDDVVFGEGGDDIILGQAGNDILNGDSGSTSAAEHGNDYLDGGDGYLDGGDFSDTPDTIYLTMKPCSAITIQHYLSVGVLREMDDFLWRQAA